MADEKNCSSSPGNAFQPEFLKVLHSREDGPLAAIEAETRGPWTVVELPAGGSGGGGSSDSDAERWAVFRAWEKPGQVKPSGRFRYREHALLWAAALEIASRRANVAVGLERDDEGHVVTEWTPDDGERTIGHTAVWDESIAACLQALEGLLRCPEALARLVQAGGGYTADVLGRRLMAG